VIYALKKGVLAGNFFRCFTLFRGINFFEDLHVGFYCFNYSERTQFAQENRY
jgi:hypothetical protein